MIYRELPNCRDAAVRNRCMEQLKRENIAMSLHLRAIELPVYSRPFLSVKMTCGGREDFFVDGRKLSVDDDCYLVLNPDHDYGSSIDAHARVHSFCLHFRHGLQGELLDAMLLRPEQILDRPAHASTEQPEFAEQLRSHDRIVTPVLRHIASTIETGLATQRWLDEECTLLLARLIRLHKTVRGDVGALPDLRRPIREESRRRIRRAADYMLSNYERDLSLEEIAATAYLSIYHFLRLFRQVYGVTPYQFLQRKRHAVAARLLRGSDASVDEIARRVGLESRISLYRLMRRNEHMSPTQVRRQRGVGGREPS